MSCVKNFSNYGGKTNEKRNQAEQEGCSIGYNWPNRADLGNYCRGVVLLLKRAPCKGLGY